MIASAIKRIGLTALAAAFMNLAAFGVTLPPGVTLAWDASSAPNVAGYRLYQGSASGIYTNVLDAGGATQTAVSGLVTGTTYFFAVTAYDADGMESRASNEIIYTVGSTPRPTLQITVQPDRQVLLRSSGPAAYRYDVLATQRFTNWTVIGSLTNDSSGLGQFTDTAAPGFSSRSYRLRQTAP